MSGIFRSTLFLSFATLLSRLAGFLRDILLAQIMGGGAVMSAWSMAQQIPNLFRRLLGEGALGTALVPILTHTLEKDGKEAACRKFSTVVIWLFFLLTLITVLFCAGALIGVSFVETERWKLTLLTLPVIMPYCILICMVGVFTSFLNTIRLFFLPALLSLIPNAFMIVALVYFLPELVHEPVKLLRGISIAVLASGVVELVLLWIFLVWKGMKPSLTWKNLCGFATIREVMEKVLPGLIGAAAFQIGACTDGLLAMYVSDYGKSAIYYADRLVYLPIGLFAVAFGTVSLPALSKYIVENRTKTMLKVCFASMRQLLYVAIPLGVVLILFAKEFLSLCFERGAFNARALEEAYQAMFWLSFGLPSFCLIKLTLNTFYCRKSMKIPACTSIVCIVLNVILSAILMFPMKQGGIALASVITGTLNNIILLWILNRQLGRMPLKGTLKFAGIILILSVIAGGSAKYIYLKTSVLPYLDFLPKDIASLVIAGIIFCLIYVMLSVILRIHEFRVVLGQIQRKLHRG